MFDDAGLPPLRVCSVYCQGAAARGDIPQAPPPGISQLAWDGLLAQAQIDPIVHAHLTRWRLGQVELVDMLAQLAVDQTVRARELTERYIQLMERTSFSTIVVKP